MYQVEMYYLMSHHATKAGTIIVTCIANVGVRRGGGRGRLESNTSV